MEPVHDLELYRGLEDKLGTPVATALMERLPHAPVDQLVTKDDLAQGLAELRAELKGDFADLKGDFATQNAGFAGLKGDFAELKGDFAELRGDFAGLKGDFADLRADNAAIRAELKTLDQRMVSGFEVVDERFKGVHLELTNVKNELIATMRGEMVGAIHSQGRLMAFSLIGALVGLSVLAFSIATLAG